MTLRHPFWQFACVCLFPLLCSQFLIDFVCVPVFVCVAPSAAMPMPEPADEGEEEGIDMHLPVGWAPLPSLSSPFHV